MQSSITQRGSQTQLGQVERQRGEEGAGISYRLRDRGERKGQGYHIG
jgi:hypothetical protein